MRAYTASIIKSALFESVKSKGLYCEGLDTLGCPSPDVVFSNNDRCNGAPLECQRAHEQKCEQVVLVYRKKAPKISALSRLRFKFTVSNTDTNGFIDCADSALSRLIADNEYITVSEKDVIDVVEK